MAVIKSTIILVDMTDVLIQSSPPTSAVTGTRWINTGSSPYILYRFTEQMTWVRETDYDVLNAFSMHDIVLEDMTADARLTPHEKSQLTKIISSKLTEAYALEAQATSLGSTSVTALSNAISALESLYNAYVLAEPHGTSDVPVTFDEDLNDALGALAGALAVTVDDISVINRPVAVALSKDSYLIPGTAVSATATTTTVEVTAYKGSALVDLTVAVSGHVTGLTTSINSTNPKKIIVTVTTKTTMTTKAGSLVFTITADDKTYTKNFVYAIALAGVTGLDGYLLALTSESHIFAGNTSTALAATTVTQVVAYKGNTQIAATFGAINPPTGMTITKQNNGTVNAALEIKVTTGLTPLQGTVIIPITIDNKVMSKLFSYSVSLKGEGGLKGKDAVYAITSAPDGEYFQSVAGSTPNPLPITCDLFVGGVVQDTGVDYQWFIQEGTANEGAGLGWKILVGATGKAFSVLADSVPSMESFKCKATYQSTAYYDVVTLWDRTDPYQVILECLQGDSFFNGTGIDKTLTARIYQHGTEVDVSGSVFNYAWQRFIGGAQDSAFSAATKSIVIVASDVLKEATYICNVSAKP